MTFTLEQRCMSFILRDMLRICSVLMRNLCSMRIFPDRNKIGSSNLHQKQITPSDNWQFGCYIAKLSAIWALSPNGNVCLLNLLTVSRHGASIITNTKHYFGFVCSFIMYCRCFCFCKHTWFP